MIIAKHALMHFAMCQRLTMISANCNWIWLEFYGQLFLLIVFDRVPNHLKDFLLKWNGLLFLQVPLWSLLTSILEMHLCHILQQLVIHLVFLTTHYLKYSLPLPSSFSHNWFARNGTATPPHTVLVFPFYSNRFSKELDSFYSAYEMPWTLALCSYYQNYLSMPSFLNYDYFENLPGLMPLYSNSLKYLLHATDLRSLWWTRPYLYQLSWFLPVKWNKILLKLIYQLLRIKRLTVAFKN